MTYLKINKLILAMTIFSGLMSSQSINALTILRWS
jgi:hypothetical protein